MLLAPGMGDGIQAAKAGILEIGDVFVVNKADRDGADQTVRDLRSMLSLGGRHSEAGAWRPPIVKTVASRGRGDRRGPGRDRPAPTTWLREVRRAGTGGAATRAAGEIEAIAVTALREQLGDVHGATALPALAERVVAGGIDPYAAADELVAAVTGAAT